MSLYVCCMYATAEDMLDPHVTFGEFGKNAHSRRLAYQEFVRAGIADQEMNFISSAFERNQLTGNDRFVKEI